MFDCTQLAQNLRVALTLKADDLRFTVGGDAGSMLQASFLGVEPFDGLAVDIYCDDDGEQIDLSRFQIWKQVSELSDIAARREWGPRKNVPDSEMWRQETLDFVEHFLSTLPSVSMGGLDATSVRNGCLKNLYQVSAAWLDLVDAVHCAFDEGGNLYAMEVAQLALLSGRDLRTIRNLTGPLKQLRTTPARQRREGSALKDQSFVGVNTLDAIDWLRRRGHEFLALDARWASERLEYLGCGPTAAHALILLGLVNIGPAEHLATLLNWPLEKIRAVSNDEGQLSNREMTQLQKAVGL